MTAVIKSVRSGDMPQITPLATHMRDRIQEVELGQIHQLEIEIAQLREELGEAQAREAHYKREIGIAREQGVAEGHKAGLAEAEVREEEQLNLLRSNMDIAVTECREALSGAERLGALLARDCLDLLFSTSEGRLTVVTDLIRTQLERIDPGGLVQLTVAEQDFPDSEVLEALARQISVPRANICADPSLKSGDARMRLALGEIDLGIARQWGCLSAVLTQMVERA